VNSTHQGDGWVTDPKLIYTIAMLRGFRMGDEVRLKECIKYGIWYELEDTVQRIDAPDAQVWNTEQWPHAGEEYEGSATPVAVLESGYYVAYWNIAAWRRPTKEAK